MGGGLVTEALKRRLVDELILHQVPVLLGGGRSFFQELPEHVNLRLLKALPAPGVTHLTTRWPDDSRHRRGMAASLGRPTANVAKGNAGPILAA
jgi:dihydrofolate reductase